MIGPFEGDGGMRGGAGARQFENQVVPRHQIIVKENVPRLGIIRNGMRSMADRGLQTGRYHRGLGMIQVAESRLGFLPVDDQKAGLFLGFGLSGNGGQEPAP